MGRSAELAFIRVVSHRTDIPDRTNWQPRVTRARAGLSAGGLRLRRFSLIYRDVVSCARTKIDLAWPGDLLIRIFEQLDPLGQPSRSPRYRKQHRKHIQRKAHCLVDDAG